MIRRWLCAILLLLVTPAAAVAQPQFPALTGRVVDGADLLSPAQEAQLTARLEALETQSQRQLVVATVADLGGYEISDYGYQLGRSWGIGDKARNDGAILLVAPNERKVRVEVGYGLEGVLTDGLSSLIIQNDILPRFKSGDMAGGIMAGTERLATQLTLPEDEARAIAVAADQRAEGGVDWGLIIFLLIIFFVFILPMLTSKSRGGRRYSGGGPVIIWGGGGGFGSGGGGGGGFGGFSGGGGSFGGGGASGSW